MFGKLVKGVFGLLRYSPTGSLHIKKLKMYSSSFTKINKPLQICFLRTIRLPQSIRNTNFRFHDAVLVERYDDLLQLTQNQMQLWINMEGV